MASSSSLLAANVRAVFARKIPQARFAALREHVVAKPMLLIAGDQLTGKSTLAKRLAKQFDGTFWSVGAVFRQIAAERNMSAGELAEHLLVDNNDSVDIEIDFRTCEIIGGRDLDRRCGVIEGRQPAHMAQFLRDEYGKQDTVSVYLKCGMRERALRFVRREYGEEAHQIACAHVPMLEGDDAGCISAYGQYLRELPIDGIEQLVSDFTSNQHRDQSDRERYIRTYQIDYTDLSAYDVVVDTSNATAEQNMEKCLRTLADFKELPAYFRERL